ncbi:MAG: glutamate--tRNA ligase [Syntrophorhabdales bacterium]|jgi:glutamyl-tRNA synthetase
MVRVRFAPSPTGNLHVGNGRTAVLNYLFARHEKGRFILRIEDTDLERSQVAFEESIKTDLRWLGIDWDEGPDRQSERLDIYRNHAGMLLERGLAYKCFCSREGLESARADALRRGEPPRYGQTCRNLPDGAVRALEAQGRPFVLRFKSPAKGIAFTDGIHGAMDFPAGHVDDFIIMRTDRVASYNFAAAVDDLLMGITHVIRGADHLPNTPKQIMLFLAFGKEPPAYAHHSLLLGNDRKPLSKRHGATTVAEFRALGILPEAMVNYLAIIGRRTDDELMGVVRLVETFSLRSFSSSDTLFDREKLLWLNKEHMRIMPPALLAAMMGLPETDREKVAALRENARTLNDMRAMLAMFEGADIEEDAVIYLSTLKDGHGLRALLQGITEGDHRDFEDLFKGLEKRSALARREILMVLRIAITGRKSGPPLKELYRFVPKDIMLKRAEWLEKRFSGPSEA